ncbi:hypothetical protein BJV82DRAFT_574406 [Fennellomyces sp. T-0311]|nr:hypothetical protein BJV82DRAFT_574406 [Fennellomyces sp. T-0311]
MSALKVIFLRSFPAARLAPHNRCFSTSTPIWQSAQRSKTRQPLLKIDSAAARAHKHLYTIPADPFIAAQRVSRILKVASVDDALEYITSLRVGLQSTAAWNTVLKHYGDQGKASAAEKCFVQMRKRNIAPNQQTFTILISAWAHSSSPAAVRNAQDVIDRMDRYGVQPTIIHYNTLLLAYEKTKTPIQDVFDRLPCKPNEYTYSIAFRCAAEQNLDSGFVRMLWSQVQQKAMAKPSLLAQKAAQVIVTEDPKEGKFTLDDRLAASFLAALARTAAGEDDVSYGIDAIDQLYGLRPASTSHKGLLVPTVYSLDSILRFFGRTRKYKLGREYYDLALKQYPQIEPDQALLDTRAWLDGAQRPKPDRRRRK